MPDDESRLVASIIELPTQYGRYGYRKVTGLLRNAGWSFLCSNDEESKAGK
ncbi:MAG: transposase [Deltaproteobacteria bacterium]|nr:MAG: transposase [Deltaproteobacteria bacterium]